MTRIVSRKTRIISRKDRGINKRRRRKKNILQSACDYLRQVPKQMISREKEQNEIKKLIHNSLLNEIGCGILLTGKPGTGKTLSIRLILNELPNFERENGLKQSKKFYLNCMDLNTSEKLFPTLSKELGISDDLEQEFCGGNKRMFVIVLDEIERLLKQSKSQPILKQIFNWSCGFDSKLILIGIANFCDLTERFLPTLKDNDVSPHRIGFPSYTNEQLFEILQQRISEAGISNYFDSNAIKFISKRVEETGDARIALDVTKKTIEIVIDQLNQGKIIDKISIPHVYQVFESYYVSSKVSVMKQLPFQLQILLCASIKLYKNEEKEFTVGKLIEYYKSLTYSIKLPSLSQSELIDSCNALAEYGLLNLTKSKRTSVNNSLITLNVSEDDIRFALHDIRFFNNIFGSSV